MNGTRGTRSFWLRAWVCVAVITAALLTGLVSAHATPLWYTQLISYSTAGQGSTGGNEWPDISADGRYVVWVSSAQNLVNGGGGLVGGYYRRDVYWRDRLLGVTKRVSVSSAGASADDHSGDERARGVAVSGDGRYVAFVSNATNLVAGDTNNAQDVFVHDTVSGVTERVSVTTAEEQASAASFAPIAISDEGTHVVFTSIAANLGSSIQQVYLRDRVEGTTEIVSKDSAGNPGDSSSHQAWDISPDGRFVVFSTEAANITGSTDWYHRICVRDRLAGTTVMADVTTGNQRLEAAVGSISDDGRYVAFHGGSPFHVWVRDLLDRTTVQVSRSTEGTLTTEDAVHAEISGDGRYVVFQSLDSTLVADDTNDHVDIFRHDRETGMTERMNLDSTGAQAEYGAYRASVSRNGQVVAFLGMAPLVPEVITSSDQIYVRAFGELPLPRTDTTMTLTAPRACAYGSAALAGRLTDDQGAGLPGKAVQIQYLSGATWVDAGAPVTTEADGTFAVAMAPKTKTTYRADFGGDTECEQATSPEGTVLPKVRLTRRNSWTAIERNKTYYAKGYVEPRHYTSDSNKVKIRAYKKGSDGKYRYVKTFPAKYVYYSTSKTAYKAAITFTKSSAKGSWKLVAYHATDSRNYKTYGSADYVRVR